MINLLRLIGLLVLGILTFFGLGWLILRPLLIWLDQRENSTFSLFREFPLAIILGLLLNFFIVLCIQSLQISLILTFIGGVAGIVTFIFFVRKNHSNVFSGIKSQRNKSILALLFCSLLLFPIIVEPLSAWDARYIWFFQGKIIYYFKALNINAGFNLPFLNQYSHLDYPKLFSSLIAQIAFFVGYWNEYLPKLAIFFIAFPAVFLLFNFAERSLRFAFLFLLLPLSYYPHLLNGYVDGLLGFYFSLALLFLGIFFKKGEKEALFVFFVSSAFLIHLKNEGAVAFLTLIGTLIIMQYFLKWRRGKNTIKSSRTSLTFLLVIIIMLVPFIIWSIYKRSWNLSNDLQIGSVGSVSRIVDRLQDGSIFFIIKRLFDRVEVNLMIFALVFFSLLAEGKRLSSSSIQAFIAGAAYGLGLILIYLMTPLDLTWHITTSATRTMFLTNAAIIVSVYFMLPCKNPAQPKDQ